ncbi:MAG: L-serine ammonia-lyase, iron-sulfur-dependent, subunit alpha [Atopobiaceae bacterium]
MKSEEALAFLHETVAPSLGCTEPACAALAAAAAASVLGGTPDRILLTVNPGLYKNGMSVAIPGFDAVGMPYAAALGAAIRSTDAGLQIFSAITPEIAGTAHALVDAGKVEVSVDADKSSIYALCTISSGTETAEALIEGSHTNIVRISHNGKACFEKDAETAGSKTSPAAALEDMTIEEISDLVDSMDPADLDWLVDAAQVNSQVAAFGEKHPSPVGIASALSAISSESEADEMVRAVGSAIESRLDGAPCTVSSSAGAGSKGLALTLPLTIAAEHAGSTRADLARALAFGHLLNSNINAKIGKLAAVCTCAAAASTAASAALVKLWGGSTDEMGFAIRNMTGTIAGMICDGGKCGCGMKLGMATSAAYLSAKMACAGSALRPTDGICDVSPEQCIENMARIAHHGMADVDEEILSIMLAKKNR